MISLQQLTPADAEMLAEVGSVSLLQSHGHSAPDEVMQAYVNKDFSIESCRSELANAAHVYWAAYYNDAPAGYFKIQYAVPHAAVPLQAATKLQRLYLLNDFLGKQLGHQLLQKAMALSKQAGDEGMWLNVWKENERAFRFYQKQGFEIVGESLFVLTETHANPNWVMWQKY